jgi:hypothetical protein
MAIRLMTESLDIIASLSDEPNAEEGLTAEELKGKFDEGGKLIQQFLNEELIPDVTQDIIDAVEAMSVSNGNLPQGGAAGEVLVKSSAADYDAAFRPVTELISGASIATSASVVTALSLGGAAMLDDALLALSGSAEAIAGNVATLTGNSIRRGTCATAAATAAKAVTVAGYALTVGVPILVTFSYANTAASPTLNVSGTGAKPIWYQSAAIQPAAIRAGVQYLFTYDGTRWSMGYISPLYASATITVPSTNGQTAYAELGFFPKLVLIKSATASMIGALIPSGTGDEKYALYDTYNNAYNVTVNVTATGVTFNGAPYYTNSGAIRFTAFG